MAFWPIVLQPRKRRILQAVVFEALALAIVTPVVAVVFGHPPMSSFVLSALMSSIALAWNYGFNTVFERWEARQPSRERTWCRRLAHGAFFEIGLSFLLIPLMALWLGVSLWEALAADIGLLLFFFVYTVIFTWMFDRLVALPAASPAGNDTAPHSP